jgi:outer membrane protein assembly factor BamB
MRWARYLQVFTVAFIGLLGLAPVGVCLADWPLFRGDPALTGFAAGSLPDKPELRWTFKGEGEIKSSPVVTSNRVYFGSSHGHLVCLGLGDGKKVWEFKAGDGIEAAPAVFGGMVYVGSARGVFYALDAASGRLKWQHDTEGQIAGSANWIAPRAGQSALVVFGSYDNKVYGLQATTGKVQWTVTTQNYINGTPSVDQEKVVFGGCDGLLHIVGARDGRDLGHVEVGSYIAGSAALDRSLAFFGHYGNQVLCVDIDRKSVIWTYGKADGGDPFFSSPALGPDRLVIGGRDSRLHCLDRKTGKALWTFKTRGDVDGSPVICGDKAVFGSKDGRVYLVKLADGTLVWDYEIGTPVLTSPAVTDGLVVVGADDGRVVVFGTKK